MRGELDFEAYVAARGSLVVRVLGALGLDVPAAEDATAETFAGLRPAWRDLRESADPDVALWATVLSDEARRRRRRHEAALDEPAVARALRETAALEELQVCDVLDVSVPRLRALLAAGGPGPAEDDAEPATAHPLPYARVRAAAHRQRRRRWALVSAIAGATALAVGVAAVLARPSSERPGDALRPVTATAAANPAGVVWWADGDLHLAKAVLEVPGVRRLVAAGTGAAYVDGQGRLIAVLPDGHRTLLGRPADGSPLVSSPKLGLVAWVDVSVADRTRLVVWDVDEGHQVGAVATGPGVRPITFDGGWLRFGQGLTDWAWDPAGGPAQLTGDGAAKNPNRRTALVDAVAGTRLEQWGTYLRVVRAGQRGATVVTGFGGSLSPDGRLVLTGAQEGRAPRLFDARTGERLDAWGSAWRIRAAAFAGDDQVTWLFDQDGHLAVHTCAAREYKCTELVVVGKVDQALLASDSRR